MKTVEISGKSEELTALLEQAQQEDLIVRSADGNEYMLFAISDFDYEIALTRKNKKLMAFLDKRAKQAATIPLSDVKKQFGL